ncbi:MAG: hypothetical protein ABIB43_01705 [archaeon]
MGRFGWHSGSVKPQNLQSGTVDITTDGSGDGSTAVTFKNTFKSKPAIILTSQEADITGTLTAVSPATTGFTATVDGSAVTTGTLTVGWIAMDDSARH